MYVRITLSNSIFDLRNIGKQANRTVEKLWKIDFFFLCLIKLFSIDATQQQKTKNVKK